MKIFIWNITQYDISKILKLIKENQSFKKLEFPCGAGVKDLSVSAATRVAEGMWNLCMLQMQPKKKKQINEQNIYIQFIEKEINT